VASRRFSMRQETPFVPLEVFSRLSRDGAAAAFLCSSPDGCLVGASPEILVCKTARHITSTPMAGSRSRRVGDRAQAAQILMSSEKDVREHRLVVDHIVTALRSKGADVDARDPFVLGTERMWHLATTVTGVLAPGDTRDSVGLAEWLHPTPAVCGTPRDRAFRYIRRHEAGSRGLYSGVVGWQGQNGDGEWRVTLRCGLIDGDTVLVASGAGLVAGSDVQEELSMTKEKALTIIDAL
jgi:isochorismate synthase